MEFQALDLQNEWRQVPEVCKSPTSELLHDRHVHCSAASAAVFCVQVSCRQETLRKAAAYLDLERDRNV